MAFRADEPFTPPGVPEAEGTTADAAGGQSDITPGTLGRATRRDRDPNVALLFIRELGGIRGHESDIVTTTLPNCSPDFSLANASAPRSSGNSESISYTH